MTAFRIRRNNNAFLREESHAFQRACRRGACCHGCCLGDCTGLGRIIGIYDRPGPADPRNNYVPQAGAVFVVDNAKGQISMCFPDNKDNKVVVICTPATKLP